MTITQTMEVPDNRLLTIKVPQEVPTGARVIIQFPVQEEKSAQQTTAPQEALQQAAANKEFAEQVRRYVEEQKRIAETIITPETRGLGGLKGKIWIADDFCDPIEDFKDYM